MTFGISGTKRTVRNREVSVSEIRPDFGGSHTFSNEN